MKPLYYLLISFLLFSCSNKETPLMLVDLSENFDIILVAGQSNTHYGTGLDEILDASTSRIVQLGRFDEANMQIVEGKEPLQHHTPTDNRIGFALTFSKLYADQYLAIGRTVLIIPCGYGGTGFTAGHWNKGDDLYEDAVMRTNHVVANYPNSKIVAILWHQGESDVGNANYQSDQDTFIQNLRTDTQADSVPFIVGGMVPYWVNQSADRITQQTIIKTTTDRLSHIGYADPALPFVIEKPNNTVDEIHYSADGQRELGKRYFEEYVRLRD